MPNLSTAVDDFDDGVLNTTLWTQRTGATISESAGALHVPSTLATGRAGTNAAYTFDSAFAQVSLPARNGAAICLAEVMVTSPLNVTLAELGFQFNVVTGVMNMQSRLAGIDLTTVSLPYDPVAHRWVKVRRDGSNVVWETSPNGVTWTVRRTAAIPLWLSVNNDIRFFAIATRDSGTVSDFLVHNFNVAPQRQISAGVSFAATGGGSAAAAASRRAAAALSATGGGSAAGRAVRGAGAVAAAVGAMSDAARRTRVSAATGSGSGSLSAAARRTRVAGTAVAATGGLSGVTQGVRGADASAAATGALGGSGAGVRPGGVVMAGTGDAGAAPAAARTTAVAADGTGGLSVGARGRRPADTTFPGETAATVVPGRTAAGFAAAQSAAALSAAADRTAPADAALSAAAAATAVPAPVDRDTAAGVAGVADLDATGSAVRDPATAPLDATGGVSAFPTGGTITDAAAPGGGELTASPARTAEGSVTLAGTGGLGVEGERIHKTAGRAPTIGGNLNTVSGAVRGSTVTLPGAGQAAAADFATLAVREGEVTAAATGGLSVTARVVRRSAAAFAATSAMWHEGRVPVAGSGTVTVSRLSGAASPARLSGSVESTPGGGSAVAALQPLTLYEGNDETLSVTILPADGESLSTVTAIEFYLKADACDGDDDDGVLFLSTENPPGGVTIVSQSADEIVATVEIPASALVDPYGRFWRLDVMTGVLRRTAMYGPVTVLDL